MLEILLQEWSESKLGSEPRAALDKSVCALLEHPHADFDETCAMILMQTYKYESGLNRLLEKLNMYVVERGVRVWCSSVVFENINVRPLIRCSSKVLRYSNKLLRYRENCF